MYAELQQLNYWFIGDLFCITSGISISVQPLRQMIAAQQEKEPSENCPFQQLDILGMFIFISQQELFLVPVLKYHFWQSTSK